MPLRTALSALTAFFLAMGAGGVFAQSTQPAPATKPEKASPAAKPRKSAAPEAVKPAEPPASVGVAASELQPQLHASNAGITACFDTLARATSTAIDGQHQAFSTWDTRAPNDHPFRSIISLTYPNPTAPRGAAVVINGPGANGACDSTAIQVLPTTRSCSTIQADLIKGGKALANLAGLALIKSGPGTSYLLLPTAGSGCVVLAVTPFTN